MMPFILIGVPIIVAVLMYAILTLPDEEMKPGTKKKKTK